MCTIFQAQTELIGHKIQDINTARNDLNEVNSNMNSLLTSASCDEVSFINLVSSLEMDIKKQVGVAKEAMHELDYQALQFNATDFTSEFAQQLSTWSVTTNEKVLFDLILILILLRVFNLDRLSSLSLTLPSLFITASFIHCFDPFKKKKRCEGVSLEKVCKLIGCV
jgi:hypothetical protein